MKSKVTQRQESIQKLSALHKSKGQIGKNESEKKLHRLAAEAFQKAAKTNAKPSNETVSVPLETFSAGLLERESDLEVREARVTELEIILWQGRYCDYLAKVLAKVKSSASWQNNAGKYRTLNWVQIRRDLILEDENGVLTRVLKLVAKELGYTVRAMKKWIYVYAERCDSKAHHAGFDTFCADGDVNRIRDQILADNADIYDITPPGLQPSIPHILVAMKDYEKSMFEVCTPKSWKLTAHGKRVTGQ